MSATYFTLEEANSLLPVIAPLMETLLEKRALASRMSYRMPEIINDTQSGVGGAKASAATLLFDDIDHLVAKIESYGCVVKNVNVGLVDFLADHNGRDIYLCWQFGESEIGFFHDLHTGYNGRQPVDALQL